VVNPPPASLARPGPRVFFFPHPNFDRNRSTPFSPLHGQYVLDTLLTSFPKPPLLPFFSPFCSPQYVWMSYTSSLHPLSLQYSLLFWEPWPGAVRILRVHPPHLTPSFFIEGWPVQKHPATSIVDGLGSRTCRFLTLVVECLSVNELPETSRAGLEQRAKLPRRDTGFQKSKIMSGPGLFLLSSFGSPNLCVLQSCVPWPKRAMMSACCLQSTWRRSPDPFG